MLPIELCAIAFGSIGVCIKIVRRKLMSKTQKHDKIKTIAESKMNSIKDLISKALSDGQISEQEFKMVLDELDKYYDMKKETYIKQSGLSETERKQLIEKGKAQALSIIQKSKRHIMLFNKFIFVN